jgi:hypothetical protein
MVRAAAVWYASGEDRCMAQKCPNCGATLTAGADPRVTTCPYCAAEAPVALDAAALAQSLNRDFKTVSELFVHLAQKLAREFPRHTKIQAESGWFSSGPTTGFEVTVGDVVLAMKRSGHDVVSTRKKVVRGIALKTETLSIADWVEALADSLADVANESSTSREALERLAGRR